MGSKEELFSEIDSKAFFPQNLRSFSKNDYSSQSDFIYPCRWEEGPSMTSGRSSLSSLMSPPHLVCPGTDPLAHSCPALGDTDQKCALEPGTHNQLSEGSGLLIINIFYNVVWVNDIIFNLIQVT